MARAWIETWQKRYNPSAAGTTPLFSVGKGDAVLALYGRVDTARSGGTSLTVGDGDDVDGYFVASPDTSTGHKTGDGAYFSGQAGKIYGAADTIDAVLTGTPTTYPDAVFEVVVLHTNTR